MSSEESADLTGVEQSSADDQARLSHNSTVSGDADAAMVSWCYGRDFIPYCISNKF